MSNQVYNIMILSDYSNFEFSNSNSSQKPTNTMIYYPIFGVGTIDETLSFARHARRIKFTQEAINYYSIPDNVVESNIEEPGKDKYFYDKDKPYFNFLIGKTVGIVKRIIVDKNKIDKYHCPKYVLIEIIYPYMFHMCTANLKCLETGEILTHININRLAIPELVNKSIY